MSGAETEFQEYYVRVRGRVQGPVDVARLKAMIARGRVGRHDQLSTDGRSWFRAGEISTLFAARGERKVRRPVEEPADEDSFRVASTGPPDLSNSSALLTIEDEVAPDSNDPVWYYTQNDEQQGPVSLETLRFMASTGAIAADAYVWTEGMESWQPVETAIARHTEPSVPRHPKSQGHADAADYSTHSGTRPGRAADITYGVLDLVWAAGGIGFGVFGLFVWILVNDIPGASLVFGGTIAAMIAVEGFRILNGGLFIASGVLLLRESRAATAMNTWAAIIAIALVLAELVIAIALWNRLPDVFGRASHPGIPAMYVTFIFAALRLSYPITMLVWVNIRRTNRL